jgi:hypothetical protein
MDEVEIALRGEGGRVGGWRVSRRGRLPGIWAARGSGWLSGRLVRPARSGVGGGFLAGAQAGGEPHGAGVEAQVLEVRGRLEGNPRDAGRRACDRVGAFKAWRRRAARAHDRGDPRACWCDQAPASPTSGEQGDPVPGAGRGPGR